jgi:cell division protein FtsB
MFHRFVLCVFLGAGLVLAQQPTPQQQITATVSQIAQTGAAATVLINQIPAMLDQIEKLQKENDALKAEIAKKEAKK